jgi:hypothetical protein
MVKSMIRGLISDIRPILHTKTSKLRPNLRMELRVILAIVTLHLSFNLSRFFNRQLSSVLCGARTERGTVTQIA